MSMGECNCDECWTRRTVEEENRITFTLPVSPPVGMTLTVTGPGTVALLEANQHVRFFWNGNEWEAEPVVAASGYPFFPFDEEEIDDLLEDIFGETSDDMGTTIRSSNAGAAAAPASLPSPYDPIPEPKRWKKDLADADADLKAKWKKEGLCPECGHRGEWINFALVCPKHGKFAG